MKRLGYLGPSGTFSELAAHRYSADQSHTLKAASSIAALFDGFENNHYNKIIVPIENSLEGPVNTTLDRLVDTSNATIIGEVILKIAQCLIGHKGQRLSTIGTVMSHPQAIHQCQHYLRQNFSDIQVQYTDSTAAAGKLVAGRQSETEAEPTVVAIGSEQLAKTYGLVVLARNIQDNANNETRFVVIASEPCLPSGTDKTSIIFSTRKDEPGSLNNVLAIFAKKGINLTKIESRPSKKDLGDYLFFIDLAGHIADENMAKALNETQKKCHFYKFLGSYKRDFSVLK